MFIMSLYVHFYFTNEFLPFCLVPLQNARFARLREEALAGDMLGLPSMSLWWWRWWCWLKIQRSSVEGFEGSWLCLLSCSVMIEGIGSLRIQRLVRVREVVVFLCLVSYSDLRACIHGLGFAMVREIVVFVFGFMFGPPGMHPWSCALQVSKLSYEGFDGVWSRLVSRVRRRLICCDVEFVC